MNSSAGRGPRRVALPVGEIVIGDDGAVRVLDREGNDARPGSGVAASVASLVNSPSSSDTQPELLIMRDEQTSIPSTAETGFASDVDMSSWNVVVGGAVVVKAAPVLGAGDRGPRLLRAVRRHHPEAVPALVGTLSISDVGRSPVLMSVTRLIPGAVDGWTWGVQDVLHMLDDARLEPHWPSEVGALIARMHHALAQECSVAHAHGVTHDVERDLERQLRGEGASAVRLRAREQALRAAIVSTPPPSAPLFEPHGDLHVGQILRGDDGALHVIDFDGDPQYLGSDPAADAALDIAHLLVSIDLVGAVVHRRRGARDSRVDEWCDRARRDLLQSYRAALAEWGAGNLLDESRLPGLMAAQLVRELTYASDYLPRWAYAADYAIQRRYPPVPTLEDIPWTPPHSAPISN